MIRCPERQQLVSLIEDRLPDKDRTRIEIHVETCVDCQSALEDLSPTGPEMAGTAPSIEGAKDASDRQHDGLVERLLRAICDDKIGATHPTSDAPDTVLFGHQTSKAGLQKTKFGDYELIEEIAHGGMGVVFKARQLSLKRIVALKMVLSSRLGSEEVLQRFRAEAEAAALLDHPNIVPIYEVGEHAGQHYFSMKLVDGSTLSSLKEEFLADSNAVATLMSTIAHAIHAAHQRGILHRDLKPRNILVQDLRDHTIGESSANVVGRSAIDLAAFAAKYRPMITDFGLAKQIEIESGMTQSGQIMGTPSYMAPEQASGQTKGLTTAVDIYGMGAILYELLTGRPPFDSDSIIQTLRQVAETEPTPPHQLNPRVNHDLATIAMKCLEKDPASRYGSAEAMAEDLDRWLRGKPITARPVSTAERLVKWTRRNPIAAIAGLLIMVLSVGGPLMAIRQSHLLKEADVARQGESQQRKNAEAAMNLAITRADTIRRNLYFAQINQAQQASNDIGGGQRAMRLLDGWLWTPDEKDLRGWEWFYLKTLTQKELASCEFDQDVEAITWSRDGRWLAASDDQGCIYLWQMDQQNQRLIANADGWQRRHAVVLKEHRDAVEAIAFSPDTRQIASASKDKTVKIWNVAAGRLRNTLKHDDEVTALAWDLDGARIATGNSDRTLMIWDVNSGQKLMSLNGHPKKIQSIDWNQDQTRIACGGGRLITVFDVSSGNHAFPFPKHDNSIQAMSWSKNRKWLAVSDKSGDVIVWDAKSYQERYRITAHAGSAQAVCFSPDSTRFATGGTDATTHVFDTATGEKLLELHGHTDDVSSLAWSRDCRMLASASYDQCVKIWYTGPAKNVLQCDGKVVEVSVGAKGKFVVCVTDKNQKTIWNVETGEKVRHITEEGQCVAWNKQGTRIALGTNSIVIWDPDKQTVAGTIPVGNNRVRSLAWNPDGVKIAALLDNSRRQQVVVWNVNTGRVLATIGDLDKLQILAWSPDGRQLAAADAAMVRIWDADTWQRFEQIGNSDVKKLDSFTWSPDGTWLATGYKDGMLRIWAVRSDDLPRTIEGHTGAVTSLAWHPEGLRLASAGSDHTVRIWDPMTGEEVLNLHGHTDGINRIQWSPDGTKLVSASDDQTIRIWDATRAYERDWSPALLRVLNGRIEQDPRDFKSMNLRAQALGELGRWELAKKDLRKLAESPTLELADVRQFGWWALGPLPLDMKLPLIPINLSGSSPSVTSLKSVVTEPRWWKIKGRRGKTLNLRKKENTIDAKTYVLQKMYAYSSKDVVIEFGADDRGRLWVNGTLVANAKSPKTLKPKRHVYVSVTLDAGWNTLFAEVENDHLDHLLRLNVMDRMP